jgi:peptidoglycan hydrolase-like protein with peptidoglycan-binding domain
MVTIMKADSGSIAPTAAVTGRYDDLTARAVRNIQAYFGLLVTGTMGKAEYFLFGQGVDNNGTYGGPVYGSRRLYPGSSGGDVVILQNRLNVFRYAATIGHPANGVFDTATTQAVLEFKQDASAMGDAGFLADGIAAPDLYNATWLYTVAGGRTLESGRDGFDVMCVQAVLQSLGFYTGRLTGYYDGPTHKAVAAFQKANGITTDGMVGPVTFYYLGLNNAVGRLQFVARTWPRVCVGSSTPPAVGCVNGVDNNVDLSGVASCLKSSGYSFVLRYLGGPCYHGVPLTPAEVQVLTSSGLMLGTIYVGANSVSAFTCGVQTFDQGQLDGAACVRLAQAIGQPTDSAIYLDLQGDQISPQASWLAYVQGWAGVVADNGYRPGVYSSPLQLEIIHGQPWGASAILYWVAQWISVGAIVPPPCPTTELSYAVLWQYSDGTCICGINGFDIDTMQTPAGFFA